jgi:hypothetical protein
MNMQPIISIYEEDEQALLIQREVGTALRLSFDEATCEPLPTKMALLLLRLALAQSPRVTVAKDRKKESQSALSYLM